MSEPGIDWNATLAACLHNPSRAAWKRFVEATHPVVMGTLCARADEETARDLCQSFYLKLLEDDCRRLRAFDPEFGVPLPAYLRVLVIRFHIDWLRGRASRAERAEIPLEALAGTLHEDPEALARLSAREIREAVEALEPHPGLAVRLVLDGLAVKEVAQLMGLTEGGAAALLWRARRELKTRLAGGWGDPSVG